MEDLYHEQIEVRKLGEGVVWKIRRIQFNKILCVFACISICVPHVVISPPEADKSVTHASPAIGVRGIC